MGVFTVNFRDVTLAWGWLMLLNKKKIYIIIKKIFSLIKPLEHFKIFTFYIIEKNFFDIKNWRNLRYKSDKFREIKKKMSTTQCDFRARLGKRGRHFAHFVQPRSASLSSQSSAVACGVRPSRLIQRIHRHEEKYVLRWNFLLKKL